MSNFFQSGVPTSLCLTLEDGSTALFPRAIVFVDGSGAVDTSLDLGHVGMGRYTGSWVPSAAVDYEVLFLVYTDAAHTTLSNDFSQEKELWQPAEMFSVASPTPNDIADAVWDELLAGHTIADSSGEHLARLTQARADNIDDTNLRARLVEKILRNRLELADGTTNNWVLYDDDSVTPLLTWSVSDKSGQQILQAPRVPSRRTRGV